MAGCAGSKTGAPLSTASTKPVTHEALLAEAQTLNAAYKKNPEDTALALRFAKALDAMGSKKQSLAILATATDRHPDDRMVLAAYGKSLLSVGRAKDAVAALTRAHAIDDSDWRVASALGLAHDQMKEHGEARKFYANAVALAPEEASIQNNAGLSFALDGDLKSAEKVLRIALKTKGAGPRVRQNLALILGLQGRFEEAEKVARMDLPSDKADQNIAYLRNMLAQPNAWNQIAEIDKNKQGGERRYKKVMAAVPVRKPVMKSVGGPLIALNPDLDPDAVIARAKTGSDADLASTTVAWPTGATGTKAAGVPLMLKVATADAPYTPGKVSGVND